MPSARVVEKYSNFPFVEPLNKPVIIIRMVFLLLLLFEYCFNI